MTKILSNAYCGVATFLALTFLMFYCASATAAAQDQTAQSVFNSTCASCHGQNGSPTAVGKSLSAPDLTSGPVQSQSTAQLQRIISDGKANMPPFKTSLSAAQISSIVAYIRTLPKQHKSGTH